MKIKEYTERKRHPWFLSYESYVFTKNKDFVITLRAKFKKCALHEMTIRPPFKKCWKGFWCCEVVKHLETKVGEGQ